VTFNGYTFDMEVYLVKDRKWATTNTKVPHATVKQMVRVEGHGHKLYMDNKFSTPDDLTEQKINC
jgi:hypothetical protein